MPKSIVEVPISVDESSMASRGWNVLDARARISYDMWHSLAISVDLQFVKENWTGRYKGLDWLSPVLIEISSPTLGETRYIDLTLYDPNQLRGGKARESVSGSFAYDVSSIAADDISVRLLSRDAADVSNRIYPLEQSARSLPLEFLDETSEPDASDLATTGSVFVTAGEEGGGVVVTLAGETTTASYDQLVEITARREMRKPDKTFEYILPDLEIDVLDDTDFLLDRKSVYLGLDVSGKKAADLPSCPAQWITYIEFGGPDLAGDPSKVAVRLVDADY